MKQLIIILLFATSAMASENELIEKASRDVIVKWRTQPAALDASLFSNRISAKIETMSRALPVSRESELSRISVLRLKDERDVAAVLSELRFDSRIEYVEQRQIRTTDEKKFRNERNESPLDGEPNDPFYAMQWALQAVDAESAWNTVLGSPDVVIAVVDVGVAYSHPDLEASRWENTVELSGIAGVDDDGNGFVDDFYGYDFLGMDGDPTPDPFDAGQTHGTHVAGIAAATRNNGRGIAGIAAGCKIMGVRSGSGNSIAYGYEGIYYACRAGAKIINCSWGGSAESAYERDMVDFAISHGCIIVAAAGNDHSSEPHFPAGIEGTLSVAATRLGDFYPDFSNFGSWVKVSAPGVNILSTVILNPGVYSYSTAQGTSMSAPLVAGICGLVMSKYPAMPASEVYSRVIGSAIPMDERNPGRAGQLGMGRVSAWRAVSDSLTGVRFAGAEFSEIVGNGDGRITEGETAAVTISVWNDMETMNGVYATLFSPADSILIPLPTVIYGNLQNGGPYQSQQGFQIALPPGTSRGRIVPFAVDFYRGNGSLAGRSTFTLFLDSTFAAVDNGVLSLGLGANGSLGYYDYVHNQYIGPGLKLSERPANALFHGSFLFGADGLVSDNGYGNDSLNREDWVSIDELGAHSVPSDRADLEYRARFDDRGADISEVMFAEVEVAALAWTSAPNQPFLILEYTITNRSANNYESAIAGLFFDWDLGPAGGNIGAFEEIANVGYVTANVPNYPMIGLASITDPFRCMRWIDNRAELDSTGYWSDERKWQFLNDGANAPPTDPKDISQLAGIAPFPLPADSSRTVAFALVTGNTPEELFANADLARTAYGLQGLARPSPEVAVDHSARLYPNPVLDGQSLKLRLPENGVATVRIFNLLGQQIAEWSAVESGPAGTDLGTAGFAKASGLLFYSIETPHELTQGKLMILR